MQLTSEPGSPPPCVAAGDGCDVVFDGVLYNRSELAAEFAAGEQPETHNAELLRRAYLRWGEELPARIRGIFALVLRDTRRELILCVRDPLGTYPLFHTTVGDRLLAGRSMEALLRQPGVSVRVNRAAVADHARGRWPDLEETYYTGILRVPPGHVLRVDRAGRNVSRYWDPAPPGATVNWIGDDALEKFDAELERSVTRFLDLGPAGIFLSGGLDSVSVAAVALADSRQRGLSTPWALSLGFPGPEVDETPVQTAVASQLGLPQVLVPFDEATGAAGFLRTALDLSRTLSAPLLSPWLPAYRYLAEQGRLRGCRVILTGGGGDEWLSVTPRLAADLLRAGDLLGWLRLYRSLKGSFRASHATALRVLLWSSGFRPILRRAWSRSALRRIARNSAGAAAPHLMAARRDRLAAAALPPWFAPDPELARELRERVSTPGAVDGDHAFYLSEVRTALDHPLIAIEAEELFESAAGQGLRLLRPYWDADLVDLLYRVPPQVLISGGRTKGLVRQSLARRFPELGFDRQKKVDAGNFFHSLVLGQGPAIWKEQGGTPALAEMGIVEPYSLRNAVEGAFVGAPGLTLDNIWMLLNLEAWLKPRL